MVDKKVNYFTSGGGRPFDMAEHKAPAKTGKERQTPKMIDMSNLDKPGSGPVNFRRRGGSKLTIDTGITGESASIKEPSSY